MRVLLVQLDGKFPNLALMRVSAYHKSLGDDVTFRKAGKAPMFDPGLWDNYDRVYGSAIFSRTRPLCERLLTIYPRAILGGTGWDVRSSLEEIGIQTHGLDYSLYPDFRQSIGFTQRGCRLKCPFCVVPAKEGTVRPAADIHSIWRGDPHPRELLLLDNDFFGQPGWRNLIEQIRSGDFKVCLTQGINARFLSPETATAVASIHYSDDQFQRRRLYTAWDSAREEQQVFRGLRLLLGAGVRPDHMMVYMLIGYDPSETPEDREYRRRRLREFGARPYPMPFIRTPELVGFQRWVIGAYDKRISWAEWVAAGYRPERLGSPETSLFPEEGPEGLSPSIQIP